MAALLSNRLKYISSLAHKLGTIVLIPTMVGLITLDVFLRYIFNAPIWGSKEVNGLLLVMVFFLSMIYCWDKGKHVNVEILYGHFKGRVRSIANMVTALAGMIFSGLLAGQYIKNLPFLIKTQESGEEIGIPVWPFKTLIATCCILLFVRMLSYLTQNIRNLF